MKPGFIGKIGCDSTGEFFRSQCEELGIELKLSQSDMASGIAYTFISPDGERTFGTYLGAASSMTAEDIFEESFRGYDYLYVEGFLVQNHDMILKAVKTAKNMGLKICIDLASFNVVAGDLDFFHSLVEKYVDVVFANEEEAKAFTNKNPEEALDEIAKICDIAVVKLGSKGVSVKQNGKVTIVNSTPVANVIDTTAAGDFFAGGFMYGLLKGLSVEKCAQLGNLLGGTVIQYFGTNIPEDDWTATRNKVIEIENN